MNDAKPTCGWNEAKPYRQPESEPPVRSSEWLGDGGEHKCEVCGKVQLPLGWPTPKLCMECGRARDKTEPKACPFCGIQGAIWKLKFYDEYFIRCAVCKADGPKATLESMAMVEWNRRKSPNNRDKIEYAKIISQINIDVQQQKERVEAWKQDYDKISEQLQIVQDERARSFAMLQRKVGKCGLTSHQPEADIEIGFRVESIKADLAAAVEVMKDLVNPRKTVSEVIYDARALLARMEVKK